jgi:hypothetical protein
MNVLALARYSPRVSMNNTLVASPPLAIIPHAHRVSTRLSTCTRIPLRHTLNAPEARRALGVRVGVIVMAPSHKARDGDRDACSGSMHADALDDKDGRTSNSAAMSRLSASLSAPELCTLIRGEGGYGGSNICHAARSATERVEWAAVGRGEAIE